MLKTWKGRWGGVILAAVVLGWGAENVWAGSGVIPPGGGKGSYTTEIPAPGTRPDGVPAKLVPPACAPNVEAGALAKRKVPTSDWWTPLAWLDPKDLPDPDPMLPKRALSWQVFSDPLVMQPQRGGLAVSLNIPDSQRAVMSGDKLVAGGGFMLQVTGDKDHGGKGISPYFNAFFDQDLYLGSSLSGWNSASFSSVQVTGWSDWFVHFAMASPTERMRITVGNGGPFVLVKLDKGKPQVTFRTWNVGRVVPLTGEPFSLNAGEAKAQRISCDAFAVINKIPYAPPSLPSGQKAYTTYTVTAVFGPKGSLWTLNDTQYNGEKRGPFPKWGAAISYDTGAPVEPTTANGFFYTAAAAGKSGATEPAWPAKAGEQVKDGGITWTANTLDIRTVLNTATATAGSYYAVAVLPYPWGKGIFDAPDEGQVRQLLAFFAPYAFAEVTDTQVNPVYSHAAGGADVSATFTYTTTAVGAEKPAGDAPLRAMYPHQYLDQPQVSILDGSLKPVSATSWSKGWYWPSLKGPMLLAAGKSFVNKLDVPPCLPALVDVPDKNKADRMAAYMRQALATHNPHFLSQGSYFGAQGMHRLAMLLPVAPMIKAAASAPAAVDEVAKNIYTKVADDLAYRLSAVRSNGTLKNAAEHVLYYEPRWGSLIPSPEDGFAADSLLNDHHFHYGYFVKIAAELARWEKSHPGDPANKGWAPAYAPMIRLLIKDMANTSRVGGAAPDFPFLRHFSPYAGHSWASGSSRGNQGGQQESTSEAIQAWAAMLLWSQLNYPASAENADLERWAAYMFASEVQAAELYWFGFTTNTAFKPYVSFRQYATKTTAVPAPYVPSMVSQVFQNAMTYQTCFGNPPLLKQGIQWLPLTGSSLYLGSYAGYPDAAVAGYLTNDLPKLGDGGIPPSNKDKLLMFEALTAGYKADPRTLITAVGGVAPLDSWKMQWELPAPTYDNLILQDTSRGAMYWWIDTLLSHGVPHHVSNGASHASAACHRNEEGGLVYTAYNPHDELLRVTFADGETLEVPPLSFGHKEPAAETGARSGGGCATGAASPAVLGLLLAGIFLKRRR